MITIFADASFCHRTSAAGWGAWAKGDGWDAGSTFGGELKTRCLNAGEAEIAAIANTLITLQRQELLHDEIMLQSDCLRALQLIRQAVRVKGSVRPVVSNHKRGAPIPASNLIPSPLEKQALDVINLAVVECQTLLLRHVRGHKNGEGRQWVNRKCDEIARTHMERQRKRMKGSIDGRTTTTPTTAA